MKRESLSLEASKLRLRLWGKRPPGLGKGGVEELGRDQALPVPATSVSTPTWPCLAGRSHSLEGEAEA